MYKIINKKHATNTTTTTININWKKIQKFIKKNYKLNLYLAKKFKLAYAKINETATTKREAGIKLKKIDGETALWRREIRFLAK